MLALSGDGSYLGQDSLRGIEIALAEHDNVLLDHPLELVSMDTACTIEEGRLAAIEADADPLLIGIIGDTCSAVTEAIIPAINRANLVMISPSSMQPDLPQADVSAGGVWQQSFFRTAPNGLWQGAQLDQAEPAEPRTGSEARRGRVGPETGSADVRSRDRPAR
jgi:branched-chain amino acid transport system substrate-binding protein